MSTHNNYVSELSENHFSIQIMNTSSVLSELAPLEI
jgi:hypothetical protein